MAINNPIFNPDGKRTVLSIDGGGMRGIIPLQMLIYLEKQTGQPAYELFDFVGGTSTGAIIAAGLALGRSAEDIMQLAYRDILPHVFGKRNLAFWLRYLFGGLRALYPIEPFVEALRPFADGRRIADLDKPGILLTVKDLRTSNTYYVTNYGAGAATFADWTVAGAVAASGAAPIFFPPILGNLVDGGVGVFGNPCLATSIEVTKYVNNFDNAPKYQGFTEENIIHISLGTGFVPTDTADGAGSRFSIFNWLPYIISESIEDSAWQQAFNNALLYPNMDFRRYNPFLSKENVEQVLGVQTNNIDPLALGLDSIDDASLDLMQAIGQAYAGKIDWLQVREPGTMLMPWHTPGGRPKPAIAPVNWSGTIFE